MTRQFGQDISTLDICMEGRGQELIKFLDVRYINPHIYEGHISTDRRCHVFRQPLCLSDLRSWSLKQCNHFFRYLPPMRRRESEEAVAFANRVKAEIARQGGLVDLMWWVVGAQNRHFLTLGILYSSGLSRLLHYWSFKAGLPAYSYTSATVTVFLVHFRLSVYMYWK